MSNVLAKYDIRGIQSYIFRTNKLKEIAAVEDRPETIVGEAAEVVEEKTGIRPVWLDRNGGNALAVFDSENSFITYSEQMAEYIFRETYSLKLVYACVECTGRFSDDYDNLSNKLGRLKSSMPEVCHTGAFPICRQDAVTGFPISCKEFVNDGGSRRTVFLTEESGIKREHAQRKQRQGIMPRGEQIDDYVLEKGESSYIAVIHIDGNSMGNRINELVNSAEYGKEAGKEFESIRRMFSRIRVKDSFKEVCDTVETAVKKYETENGIKKPLIRALIQAGDDITYITRANIALPLTEYFLSLVSEKDMYTPDSGADHKKYGISACAGIAFIKSHFPFSDAYDLAEACCAQAKSKAKLVENRNNGYVGSWIDFEICGHIKDVALNDNRAGYGVVDRSTENETHLLMKPYCVSSELCSNDSFDYGAFKRRVRSLLPKVEKKAEPGNVYADECGTVRTSDPVLNRGRTKRLRQAYEEGVVSVQNFVAEARSRGRDIDEVYKMVGGMRYAAYYDAIEIIDMYDADFSQYIDDLIAGINGKEKE